MVLAILFFWATNESPAELHMKSNPFFLPYKTSVKHWLSPVWSAEKHTTEEQRSDSCIDRAANLWVPLGLNLSTSLLLLKEKTLTSISSRTLNPALIDIEFSNAPMPAVFIPAALPIELCPLPCQHVRNLCSTTGWDLDCQTTEESERMDLIWCWLQVLEGIMSSSAKS